jgi:hypothetical protein
MANWIMWAGTITGGVIGGLIGSYTANVLMDKFGLFYGLMIAIAFVISLLWLAANFVMPLLDEPIKEELEWTKQK